MGKIYSKVQKQQMTDVANEVLAFLDQVRDSDNWRDLLIDKLNAIQEESEKPKKAVCDNPAWDFSKEKGLADFASDGEITLRPFKESDKAFYYSVRKQWFTNAPENMFSEESDVLWKQTQEKSSLFCTVELLSQPVGYVAIQDTRSEPWELTAEFDRESCFKGIGTRGILLFLSRIKELTSISQFMARVEVDNLACQKCMEKIGAKLTGLSRSILGSDEEKKRFEAENLDLIDDHIRNLADQLDVEPRELLSHLLVYEISV